MEKNNNKKLSKLYSKNLSRFIKSTFFWLKKVDFLSSNNRIIDFSDGLCVNFLMDSNIIFPIILKFKCLKNLINIKKNLKKIKKTRSVYLKIK